MLKPQTYLTDTAAWLVPGSWCLGSSHSSEPQPRLTLWVPLNHHQSGSGSGALPDLVPGRDVGKTRKIQGSLGGRAASTERVTHEGFPSVPGTPSPEPPLTGHPGCGASAGHNNYSCRERRGQVCLQGTPVTGWGPGDFSVTLRRKAALVAGNIAQE